MSYFEDLASTPEGRKSLRREKFKLDVTERICEIMQEKGLDYEDMSNALDVRKKYFKRMLDGSREIDLNDLADIADVFDMDVAVDFLMRAKEEVPQPQPSREEIMRLLDKLHETIVHIDMPPVFAQSLYQQLRLIQNAIVPGSAAGTI